MAFRSKYGLRRYIDKLLAPRSRNIELQVQLNALASTARYVEQHLFATPSFPDNHSLLEYAIGQIQNDGLICEFGVYKGKSIDRIAERVEGTVHGFDSFEGLPEYWRDGFKEGKFASRPPGIASGADVCYRGHAVQSVQLFFLSMQHYRWRTQP